MSKNKLKYIVDNDLCVRCGTCVGVCPVQAIILNDHNYPTSNSLCTGCGKCFDVCPGIEVNYPELTMSLFGEKFEIDRSMGIFNAAYAGYALDGNVRGGGSSGGVVTQLLIYLLEKKIIDGAIVTTADPDSPLESKAIIARTKEDLLRSMQSRYTIVPVNQLFSTIRELEGKYALVGLPCHIHGFRKLANIDHVFKEKICLVLGIFCSQNLEQEATTDLQKISGIQRNEIQNFEYRGGDWPGAIRIKLKNGKVKNLHYSNFKDGAINYLSRLYGAKRCLYCIDGSAEFSDISFADPWVQDEKGDWKFKGGWTLIFQRTDIGRRFLSGAMEDKAIHFEKIYDESLFHRFIYLINLKKKRALVRISRLLRKNKPVPEYYPDKNLITARDRRNEYIFSLTLLISKFEWVKQILMRIIFSKIGLLLTKIRIILKYSIFNIKNKI